MYPDTSTPALPASLNVYVPASKLSPLVATPSPVTVTGPVAVNVQSVATLSPPLSFTTSLTNFNDGLLSLFVIVHVAVPLYGTVTSEQL